MRHLATLLGATATLSLAAALPLAAQSADSPPQPNDQMQAVLDQLQALGAKPLGTIDVEAARSQPTPADAVMAVMEAEGIEPDPALQAIRTQDITIPGPAGEIAARVYTPEGEGPFPVVVYYHGGGWVIADIDTYDASARALAHGADAIVVSSHYRQAPEHTFPASHEDAYAAYAWTVENVHEFNGDAGRMAVAGESAGGNLAMNVAIEARDRQATLPGHMLLVYPVAGNDMQTESYVENADAAPLSKAGMEWFFSQEFENMEQSADPRINLVERDDLGELPPATVITAQIDPLRSEGQMLAEQLEAADVPVEAQNFEGVTHEFFGMGAVVDEAKEAVEFAAGNLRDAFAEADDEAAAATE
ncbi:MAG: alpha/beta hydrolase [Rhodobacteraceae bacterium]|nr:alpha/beta hydrolase [Paracoccaceae bacterium]